MYKMTLKHSNYVTLYPCLPTWCKDVCIFLGFSIIFHTSSLVDKYGLLQGVLEASYFLI